MPSKLLPLIALPGLVFLLLGARAAAWEATLPRWEAGVRGGIPTVPERATLTVADLADDPAGAIQRAIDAVPTPGAVRLPAGRYLLTDSLFLRSGVVLRGSGERATQLVFQIDQLVEPEGVRPAMGAIRFRGERTGQVVPLEGDPGAGDRVVESAAAGDFAVGQMVLISSANDPALMYTDPRWDRDWARESLAQIVAITAIAGTTVHLDTGLRLDFDPALEPRMERIEPITRAGLENLYLTRTDGQSDNLIGFEAALDCWVRDCETELTGRGHIWINFSRFVTVAGNRCHRATSYGGGGNGYGIVAGNVATDCLIENNELHDLRHALMAKRGSSGNVFAYNYSHSRQREPAGSPLLCDISLHGHYPYQNLFEGNVVEFVELADYWGPTGPLTTFFRNHVTDKFLISDHSHRTIVWGNALPPSGVETDGTSDRLLLRDNRWGDAAAGTASRALPASLYYPERPDFWTDLPWPLALARPVGDGARIPAEARTLRRVNPRSAGLR